MNFYPFHIGDYISHTSHLTDEEDLTYRRMLDLYYQSEEPFTDTAKLARKVRSNFEVVGVLLTEFFVFKDGAWHNDRADQEIAKYKAMKDGGRKGAALRWNKGGDTPPITPPNHPLMQTKNQEPRTKNHIKDITPEGVSDLIFQDYLKIRKAKKSPWTATAQKLMESEAKKANMSLQEAMEICCARGWVGFKAEWAKAEDKQTKELPLGTDQQIAHAYKVECNGDPTQARFNSYFDMRKFILDQRDKRKVA
jgi:uncharacterized protein YdaU (DUF1376 family)